MKILIVDDSTTMRGLICRTLKSLGLTDHIQCDSGKKALGFLNAYSIDLILLDWNMPEMDGLEVLKTIKAGEFKKIPVIMCTAEQKRFKIKTAIRAGADDYIIKPLNTALLHKKIMTIAEKYGLNISPTAPTPDNAPTG